MADLQSARSRIAELEEEVAWLKGELGLLQSEAQVRTLRDDLRVSEQQARILLVLRAAKGRHVRNAFIMEAVPRTQGGESDRQTDAQICHIRKRIGFDAIATSKGFGYGLSEQGRQIVDQCLARVLQAA